MSILKISEALSIAIHSMVLLAMNKDRLRSSKEIAAILGVSEGHLNKVLQILARAKIVDSLRGPKGGFILQKESKEIRLIDIYELIEGKLDLNDCTHGNLCGGSCALRGLKESMNNLFLNFFQGTTLQDLVNSTLKIQKMKKAQ